MIEIWIKQWIIRTLCAKKRSLHNLIINLITLLFSRMRKFTLKVKRTFSRNEWYINSLNPFQCLYVSFTVPSSHLKPRQQTRTKFSSITTAFPKLQRCNLRWRCIYGKRGIGCFFQKLLDFRISASKALRRVLAVSPIHARFQHVLPVHVKEQRGRSSAPRTNHYSFSRDLWPTHPTSWNNLVKPLTAAAGLPGESVLVETLLARGERHKRTREKKRRKKMIERPKKERNDDCYVSVNITGEWKKAERRKKKARKAERKKREKVYPPPPPSPAWLGGNSREIGPPYNVVYYAFAQEGACTPCTILYKSGPRQIVLRDKF